jgi:ribosomal protein S12 methylthiotransferase
MTQRYASELHADLDEVDAFFGNRAPAGIAHFLETRPWEARDEAARAVSLPGNDDGLYLRNTLFSFRGSAYLKIAEGCDNRCSFCAIPLIRGRHRSRPPEDLEAELRHLLSRGVREVNLIAQDLASYGRDGRTPGLVELLRRLLSVEEDFSLRMLYIHPEHFPRELLRLCAEDPRVLPYFDLPMQHADEEVLRAMARSGTAADYLGLVEEIRAALPDAVLRTSLLVGYPGETPEAFNRLLDFQAKAAFDWLGVFTYSPEEGTAAYRCHEDSVEPEAESRREILEEAQLSITQSRLNRFVGRPMRVLIEEEVEGEELAIGRGFPHAPEVDGLVVVRTGGKKLVAGDLVETRILRRNGIDLEAHLPGPAETAER